MHPDAGSAHMQSPQLQSDIANQPRHGQPGEAAPTTRHRLLRGDSIRFALDILVLAAAFVLAFVVHFELDVPREMATVLLVMLLPVVALQYGLLTCFQVPKFSWSFIRVRDLPPICYALLVAAVVLVGLHAVERVFVDALPGLRYVTIPPSVIVIDSLIAILGIGGVRCVHRLHRQRLRRQRLRPAATSRRVPAILIGAGWGGSMLLEDLDTHATLNLLPVAFVDDDPTKIGRIIGGLKVAGTLDDLRAIAEEYGATTALITIANASGGAVDRIVQRCKAAGLTTKIVPQMHEIVSGRFRISQIRDVKIEDLLGRDPVVIEDSAAPAVISGHVVLVTGAGGSIGSELCRQLVRLEPKKLILAERAEPNLYQINHELEKISNGVAIVPELADIGDVERLAEVFAQHRPSVVFHAAAHKHVPLMERTPGEAIKNNVFGTKTVADVAERHGVERFILISTDKAVNPSSVIGATKRLAELYIKDLNSRSDMKCTTVRFGNVLGSAGSVVPLFREQIAKGGPVTVTHPDMERFFMTIPEASRLVLEAAGLCKGGETMLLDMGRPVKIQHMAEQMIRLSGFEPHEEIKIVYTGVRPGEKLQEKLSFDEEMIETTACNKLFVWRGSSKLPAMAMILNQLRAPGRTPEEIRKTLRQVLPEYCKEQSAFSA